MKKAFVCVLLLWQTVGFAGEFTKSGLVGVWEVSSKDPNGFVTFGKDFTTRRGESFTLVFNRRGKVKNATTGTLYDYEVVNGKLKIYQTKSYRDGYRIKDKRHYDLWAMDGLYEGCSVAKVVKKKMVGFYDEEGYKWCKIQDAPRPTVESYDYDF